MGKLYSYLYMSLDGVISSPEQWTQPYFGEDLGADLIERLSTCHAMVLGRKTYELFASFWPHQSGEVPFADLNNSVRKLVVSTTLGEAHWRNSAITTVNGLECEKEKGDLHITGSGELVRSLITAGKLDSLAIQLIPVLVGTGQRLFEGGKQTGLTLTAREDRQNGVTSLFYRPETTAP